MCHEDVCKTHCRMHVRRVVPSWRDMNDGLKSCWTSARRGAGPDSPARTHPIFPMSLLKKHGVCGILDIHPTTTLRPRLGLSLRCTPVSFSSHCATSPVGYHGHVVWPWSWAANRIPSVASGHPASACITIAAAYPLETQHLLSDCILFFCFPSSCSLQADFQ